MALRSLVQHTLPSRHAQLALNLANSFSLTPGAWIDFYIAPLSQGTKGHHCQKAALEQKDYLMIHHFCAGNQVKLKMLPPVGAVVCFDPHEQSRIHDRTLELTTPTGIEELGAAVQFCADTYICLFSQVVGGTDRLPSHVLGNTCTALAHNCCVLVSVFEIALGDRNLCGPKSTMLVNHTAMST